jgi:hypothetical protein
MTATKARPAHGLPARPARRWFGVPRWVWLAGVVGLILFAVVYGPWSQPSVRVRTIVDGLRTSSVYRQPGAPGLVNAARVRQVIGDRPIVVAILNRTPLPAGADHDDPQEALCQAIAREITDDYIWVYGADATGKYSGDDCYGSDFPAPSAPGVDMFDFDAGVNIAAQLSAQFRTSDTNLTPELEEFVLSFDAETAKDYGAIPTRGAVPDVLAARQIILACVGLVAGTVTLFLLLRLLGLALRRRSATATARAHRHAQLSTRLNQVADEVVNPRPHATAAQAEQQAAVAKRYVLALDQLEHAHTDEELTAAGHEIDTLVEQVHR